MTTNKVKQLTVEVLHFHHYRDKLRQGRHGTNMVVAGSQATAKLGLVSENCRVRLWKALNSTDKITPDSPRLTSPTSASTLMGLKYHPAC